MSYTNAVVLARVLSFCNVLRMVSHLVSVAIDMVQLLKAIRVDFLMRKPLLNIMCSLALGMGFMHAEDVGVKDDQVRELLSEGVKEYNVGRYEAASLRFADALRLDPENKLVYEFYLAAGDRKILQMSERAELEAILKQILRKANVYKKELRYSTDYQKLLIEKLTKTEEERLVATRELVAIGPRAIPALLGLMDSEQEGDARVYARAAITHMRHRAVLPLIAALDSEDERVVLGSIVSLSDIGDARALARLQQLLIEEGQSETVKRVASNAVKVIASNFGTDEVEPASVLYFGEALRYFRDTADVNTEMVANESLIWNWDKEGKELKYDIVPAYAWNELMSEQLLFKAAGYYPEYAAYMPLMAASLAGQIVENELRVKLAAERTIPAQMPEEELAALQARQTALEEMNDRVIMFGNEHLCRAVQQCIVSERYDVANSIMRILQDEWLAHAKDILPGEKEGLDGSKAGSVIVAALDHPERTVAYQAAITLAHLDPDLQFFGADKVIPLLSQAVGEWGMKVVLLVEPDYRHRNAGRRALLEKGYLVATAKDGFEAMQRLAETPVKDAIIIAGDMLPTLKNEHGAIINVAEQRPDTFIEKLKATPRLADMPVFLSLPEDDAIAMEIQNAFDGKVTEFVKRPYNGVEMSGKIDTATADAEMPSLNRFLREDVSLRAATALATVDPKHSFYDLQTDMIVKSLIETLSNRSDVIRIEALKALGHSGKSAVVDQVTDVYQNIDGEMSVPLRVAFLYAIGLLNPNTDIAKEILAKALKHDDRGVRRAASSAVGRAKAMPTTDLNSFQKNQRLNVLSAGNGR